MELVVSLCRTFPDVSFVLLGKAEVDIAPLLTSPNLHWLGPVPYDELPYYACYFDVGLIPFRLNDLTRAVNPLKLLEYLALGLPVVATRLPELEKIDGPVYLAADEAGFREHLRAVLWADRARFAERATSVARQNTWSQRASLLMRFVHRLSGTISSPEN